MPAQEISFRMQRAVLWPADGFDRYGQPKVGSPVEIEVRWNNTKRQVPDAEGNPVTVDATAVVGRRIEPGSAMWLGGLSDWLGTGSGGDESDVMEVRDCVETPDLKGRVMHRTAMLNFYRDSLPGGI